MHSFRRLAHPWLIAAAARLLPIASPFAAAFVKAGVAGIEVLVVQIIGRNSKPFAEPLVMHDFTGPQEFQRIADIGIINEAQQVVVGSTGLCSAAISSCRSVITSPLLAM